MHAFFVVRVPSFAVDPPNALVRIIENVAFPTDCTNNPPQPEKKEIFAPGTQNTICPPWPTKHERIRDQLLRFQRHHIAAQHDFDSLALASSLVVATRLNEQAKQTQ